jgi:hypothetical protein
MICYVFVDSSRFARLGTAGKFVRKAVGPGTRETENFGLVSCIVEIYPFRSQIRDRMECN